MIQFFLVCLLACAGAASASISAEAQERSAGAIGRIVPGNGIVFVGTVKGGIVRAVHVKVGQAVKAGTLLMNVQSDELKTELELAVLELTGAQKLAESRKTAQGYSVELARQRFQKASRELTAYRSLGPQAITAREESRLQSAVSEAKVALDIEQTRREIVNTESDTAIQSASKRLNIAKTRSGAEIRAPIDGTILRIDRRVGERLDDGPAMQMADLRTMYVLCQVYEGDLLKITPGMKATVRNATLTKPLTGRVEEVGRMIDTSTRLGEIRIRLDQPDPANRLVGMEVEVVIAR